MCLLRKNLKILSNDMKLNINIIILVIMMSEKEIERVVDRKYIDHVKSKIVDKFDQLLICDEVSADVLKTTGLLGFSLSIVKNCVDMIGIKNNKSVYIICINKKEVTLDDLSQYVLFMLGGNYEGIVCYPDRLESELELILKNHNINWTLKKITCD